MGSTLLEIAEIQARLDEQFLPLEPMLTGFRLVSSNLVQEDIKRIEQQLGVVLTQHFASMLLRFDFGRFTIGPIAFCNTGEFLPWIIENNRGDSATRNSWWGSGTRPGDLILVANADPYAVLLNCREGSVHALKHGESWCNHTIAVATNFELFFRALGTLFLERIVDGDNTVLSDNVSTEVGCGKGNIFWQWYAE